MKKIILIILALAMVVSMLGCSSSSAPQIDYTPEIETDVITNEEPDYQTENNDAEDNLQEDTRHDGDSTDVTEHEDNNVANNNSTQEQTPDLPEFVYSSSLDVYSISQETYIRSCGKSGDLNDLSSDEYYSAVLHMQYNGQGTLSWSEFYVRVDGGEGSGAQCMDYYDWKENNWYRVHLRCIDNAVTGNTELEFWVCDLETGEYTLICSYDLCTGNVAFEGSIAFFLESYINDYMGEIRTLEVRNAMYLDEKSGQWKGIYEADIMPNVSAIVMDYIGSYDYGVEGNTLWIMTTGVGDNQDDSAGKHLYFGN